MQVQNQQNQHPIIIQTSPMQGQQILHVGQSNAQSTPVYINTTQQSTDD